MGVGSVFKKIGSVLATAAPMVATAAGLPGVGNIARNILGDKLLGDGNASVEAIENAVLGGSPEVLLKVKEAENSFNIKMRELDIDIKRLEFETQKLEYAALGSQVDLNKEEAKSDSLFKSGWRPGVGWTCVSGLAYSVLIQPILFGLGIPMPIADVSVLLTLLGGLLGLGGLRTAEKVKGVASK